MSRIAYVNGRYLPLADAGVNVEDRGYQLADAVYEVCLARAGRIVDLDRHLARLDRSLHELRISRPMTASALKIVMTEVLLRNRIRDGLVYLQVSRGVAPRTHAFPSGGVPPAIVVTARPAPQAAAEEKARKGVAVITVPDNRWERVDIKSVSLLPNVLAKQQAIDAGAYEAWFVDDKGLVTEGSSTNAWIVSAAGGLVTRSARTGILRGITREVLIEIAAGEGLGLEERPFTPAEAMAAREAFITSTGHLVTPVIRVDGRKIGSGRPGPIARNLRRAFLRHADASE
jgi:D-alanine transaminase